MSFGWEKNRKKELPFRSKIMNTYDMLIDVGDRTNCRTYRWGDLGNSGKQEPNDALKDGMSH
jgi:hypothetical protein